MWLLGVRLESTKAPRSLIQQKGSSEGDADAASQSGEYHTRTILMWRLDVPASLSKNRNAVAVVDYHILISPCPHHGKIGLNCK
jgi:hypothetical protein